jgi:putative Mg2+ transporter-C (MgtC) family protein
MSQLQIAIRHLVALDHIERAKQSQQHQDHIMIATWELLSRLLIAALLGSVIGFERERLNWAAGLRTHMLVCVGSALIMLVSAFGFADVLGQKNVVLDPSRVAAQVVSGIGFLGAGSILLRGEIVRGLTTAASLWSVAGIGLAVGGGMYTAAIGATVIILIILAGMKPLERRITVRQARSIQLLVARGTVSLDTLHGALGSGSVRVKQFIVQQSEEGPEFDDIQISLSRVSGSEFSAICTRLEALAGVHSCRRG